MTGRGPLATVTLIALAVGAAVGACSQAAGGPASTPEPRDHPAGATDLVVRISTSGGLLPAEARLSELPVASLYGDGQLITLGPRIAIYPGPAMPNLQVTKLSSAGTERILAAAAAAGLLGPNRHYDYPGIADAPTTTFTVFAGGARHDVSAYALTEGSDPGRLTESDRRARGALLSFQRQLTDPRSWLGKDVEGEDRPYQAKAIRIVVTPADPRAVPEQSLVNVRDWPLAGPLGTFGAPRAHGSARCGVVSGQDLAAVSGALGASNQLTFWRSDGRTYRLAVRPLLPDEHGCPPEP
ncbi:MAG: hypothetical protein M3301_00985 [Chloroflexota bacterium]|nr:hypothetical protein [Chloroflexota bacterium]